MNAFALKLGNVGRQRRGLYRMIVRCTVLIAIATAPVMANAQSKTDPDRTRIQERKTLDTKPKRQATTERQSTQRKATTQAPEKESIPRKATAPSTRTKPSGQRKTTTGKTPPQKSTIRKETQRTVSPPKMESKGKTPTIEPAIRSIRATDWGYVISGRGFGGDKKAVKVMIDGKPLPATAVARVTDRAVTIRTAPRESASISIAVGRSATKSVRVAAPKTSARASMKTELRTGDATRTRQTIGKDKVAPSTKVETFDRDEKTAKLQTPQRSKGTERTQRATLQVRKQAGQTKRKTTNGSAASGETKRRVSLPKRTKKGTKTSTAVNQRADLKGSTRTKDGRAKLPGSGLAEQTSLGSSGQSGESTMSIQTASTTEDRKTSDGSAATRRKRAEKIISTATERDIDALADMGILDKSEADRAKADPAARTKIVEEAMVRHDVNQAVESGAVSQDQVDKVGGDPEKVRELVNIKASADLMGVDEEDVQKYQDSYTRNPGADSRKDIEKDMVVDGLGLPEEARDAGLDADDLLDFQSNVDLLGLDEEVDVNDPGTWKDVKDKGADEVIREGVIENFGIPKGAVDGMDTEDILEGIADGAMVGVDDVGNENFWEQHSKLKDGEIGAEEFRDRTGGSGTGTPGGSGGSGNSGGQSGAGAQPPVVDSNIGTGTGTPGGTGTSNDDSGTPDGGVGNNDSGDTASNSDSGGGTSDPTGGSPSPAPPANDNESETETSDSSSVFIVVTHTDDGGFDVTAYSVDSSGNTTEVGSEHYTSNGDGTYSGDQGGTAAGKPEEGEHSADVNEDGNVTSNAGGDDSNDSGDDGSTDDNTETAEAEDPPPEEDTNDSTEDCAGPAAAAGDMEGCESEQERQARARMAAFIAHCMRTGYASQACAETGGGRYFNRFGNVDPNPNDDGGPQREITMTEYLQMMCEQEGTVADYGPDANPCANIGADHEFVPPDPGNIDPVDNGGYSSQGQ